MPVMKRQEAVAAMKEAIVLDMADLRRQAAQIIAAARAEASKIVEQTQARQKELVEQAHAQALARGHAEGLERGLAEGRQRGHQEAMSVSSAQLQTLQTAWIEAAQSWDGQRAAIEAEARQAVLHFAFTLAEKVIHRAVAVDPTVIVDQVSAALAHVMRPLDVSVHIHPDDRPVLEEAMPQLLDHAAHLKHVRLVDDATVGRGGCVVRYGEGEIDARLETQIQRIAELVLPEPLVPESDDTLLEQQAA